METEDDAATDIGPGGGLVAFSGAVFQLVRPSRGRSALRIGLNAAIRRIDLGRKPVSDEIIVCGFRNLMEKHDLRGRVPDEVNLHLECRGRNRECVYYIPDCSSLSWRHKHPLNKSKEYDARVTTNSENCVTKNHRKN